jgi:beta-fructofuranosidase
MLLFIDCKLHSPLSTVPGCLAGCFDSYFNQYRKEPPMYSSKGFQHSELGDVEIIKHNNLFHLFHLILPNHDYIAHAVSEDGFLWKRVKNALFIGEPGDWDDDMLWTMTVGADPDGESKWRMFYTGISRKEGGMVQRIGLARSDDLYQWRKVVSRHYPIEIKGPLYEQSIEEGRTWVSCRDPFFFQEDDHRLLLVNARVPTGPVVRRGCVGVAREVEPNIFEWQQPLFFPRMYDDIEVPGLYHIGDTYYLLGNIKEDIKVHYWHADSLFGEYEAFADNVLLPQGNYAGRIIPDGDKLLLWNFFNTTKSGRSVRILPPPAEVRVAKDRTLKLVSYEGFERKRLETYVTSEFLPVRPVLSNPTAASQQNGESFTLTSKSGYEIFLSGRECVDGRLRFDVDMEGLGKMGVLFRSDEEANAYYISLDLNNGIAQARIWGKRELVDDVEYAFQYLTLQSSHFKVDPELIYHVEVIAFGGYFELSIDGKIILRFVDTTYMTQNFLGFYVESALIKISNLTLDRLDGPLEENHSII